ENHAQQTQQHPSRPVQHELTQSPPAPAEPNYSVSNQSQHQSQPQSKPNPLQILQAAMAAGTNSSTAWENLVPGAMSLSAVEELQRREAEERYKQQQQQLQEEDGEEFEHKVERKRHSKGKHEATNKQSMKQDGIKQQASLLQ